MPAAARRARAGDGARKHAAGARDQQGFELAFVSLGVDDGFMFLNAVYMARGTGLCEFAPAPLHAEKVPNFWNLAACGRQRYGVCVAGNRRIDPKRLRRVLREITQAVAPEHGPIAPAAEGVIQPA